MPVLNTMMPAGLAEMATDQLTLDGLMDLLCDYRQAVGGKCPIAFAVDTGCSPLPGVPRSPLALLAGLIHAVYLTPIDRPSPRQSRPRLQELQRVVPLGTDVSADPSARIALCLRPLCALDDAADPTGWIGALETAR